MGDWPTNSAQTPHQMAPEQGTTPINLKILGLNNSLQHLLRCLYFWKINNHIHNTFVTNSPFCQNNGMQGAGGAQKSVRLFPPVRWSTITRLINSSVETINTIKALFSHQCLHRDTMNSLRVTERGCDIAYAICRCVFVLLTETTNKNYLLAVVGIHQPVNTQFAFMSV